MNQNSMKYVYIAAFGGIFGSFITYFFTDYLLEQKFALLAIITGGLMYTALADIFPEFK
jgi:high-affinity Fe2+/Pb2+ permease